MNIPRRVKDNSRKTGAAAEHKAKKREEAEARNSAYQALPLEQKLKRHKKGGKVWSKLTWAS